MEYAELLILSMLLSGHIKYFALYQVALSLWLCGCCYGEAWLLLRVFLALALKIRCRGLNLSDLCVFSVNNESFVVRMQYTKEEGDCVYRSNNHYYAS